MDFERQKHQKETKVPILDRIKNHALEQILESHPRLSRKKAQDRLDYVIDTIERELGYFASTHDEHDEGFNSAEYYQELLRRHQERLIGAGLRNVTAKELLNALIRRMAH